jgi:MFS family permease
VIGQILGRVLISAHLAGSSWRPIFLVNVPVCLVVHGATIRFLPADEQRQPSQPDLRGA